MTGDRLAVIDLGSNTFHLLICEVNEDYSWTPLYKERVYVKLASGGLDQIDEQSAARAMVAMMRYAEKINHLGVLQTRAIGTAALREAKNGRVVAKQLTSITGLKVEIIDGVQEAKYILRGIKACIPPIDQYGLIMDIGGGSVEFILYKGETVVFTGSYKIGVALLYRRFHRSDPISRKEDEELEAFLEHQLGELVEAVLKVPGYNLIGASGSFEVINDVLPRVSSSAHWSELDTRSLADYLDNVIHATLEERRIMPEIPLERLDYIAVAYALISYLIRKIPPERLFYCDFAVKEGVLDEMIEVNKFRFV